MSMTREEARIEIQSLKDTFEELEPGGTRTQFALKIALSALRPVSREQVEKYLVPITDQLLMGVITEQSAGMTVREEDKLFIAQVYSYSFVGLMLDWIKDGMQAEPELLVNKLALVLQGNIAQALERFRTDQPRKT